MVKRQINLKDILFVGVAAINICIDDICAAVLLDVRRRKPALITAVLLLDVDPVRSFTMSSRMIC